MIVVMTQRFPVQFILVQFGLCHEIHTLMSVQHLMNMRREIKTTVAVTFEPRKSFD